MSTLTPILTPIVAPELSAFCWIELQTRNRAIARTFFTKVIGWTIAPCDSPKPGGKPLYEEWVAADGARIGGLMEIPENVPTSVPAHFATYVNVADVDTTTALAKVLGGTVITEPTNIPDVGRFAIIQDPTGGVLNLFKGCPTHGASSTKSLPGHFCWCELLTTDTKVAGDFYCALLGYSKVKTPMPSGEYTMFTKPGSKDSFACGMTKLDAPTDKKRPQRSHWLAIVCVPDVDKAVQVATREGGTVLHAPSDVPNYGRSAVIADPTGAALGLFTPAS